jgi:predicted glutamine amidotransferase
VRATFWLLDAPDSLSVQSYREPDGTGLGHFERDGRPVAHRLPLAAYEDKEFVREARHVTSTTFVAHVRLASGSGVSLENTHPFEQRGRLFAHNGLMRELDQLETELGEHLVHVQGETDSERFFTLVTREIEREGDVASGIVAAAQWIADRLPVYSLNLVLSSAQDVWALRYPETHRLFVRERAAGGRHGRPFAGTSLHGRLRIHSLDLLEHPAVVVASEPLDESPDWRLLEPGELIHVGPDLDVSSRVVLPEPPAHLLTYADLYPQEAASQAA